MDVESGDPRRPRTDRFGEAVGLRLGGHLQNLRVLDLNAKVLKPPHNATALGLIPAVHPLGLLARLPERDAHAPPGGPIVGGVEVPEVWGLPHRGN